ncbi:MAG: hypothetical protein H0W78_15760 [Planctomycetes bacterium]|nr:hypothetical protein [Planctomycetota bacterium]
MTFRPVILFLLALIIPTWAWASDAAALPTTQRVFVCTHSFMQFTTKMLPAIAKTGGCNQVNAGEQMIGGSTCIQHWNLPDDKNKAKNALSSGNVDVLTLSPYYIMPDPGIENYTRLGLAKNPNLRVFVQSSWPAFDSPEMAMRQAAQNNRNNITSEQLKKMREAQNNGWRKTLEAQLATLNKEFGREVLKLIPVNDAVFTLRELVVAGKVPGITQQTDLFKDDIGHPTPPLALLVTYCHFAAIYGKSPVGLPVPGSLKENPMAAELTKVLQEVAWGAVTGYGKGM